MSMLTCCLLIVLMPLIGSLVAGFFRHQIGRAGAHSITILGIGGAFALSLYAAFSVIYMHDAALNVNLYTWVSGGDVFPYAFHIGFLIDSLTVVMLVTVTFISLLVHIYSIGYMADDDGYQRFFSYISLFTFMMLMLVTANNFLQLFFGWEGVGLVSYLLIGFWYEKESANQGSLKAFLVNRVGDFGFILGIGLVLAYCGSLDYQTVFQQVPQLASQEITLFSGHVWSLMTVICLLLFVGAMGKSAQVPLHVWLPESMEGPTPISALIHAATMVTAGVFMIARISPMIEWSNTALNVVLVIGGTGALFTGILALVMNDIKRVVAYSTLSQLGYMMVAMGASAYSAGIFHLMTHACFKALLFLGAGSVIVGMHHEQDMRKMGGLRKKMPLTYYTFIIGSLALCAVPPFAGFFSKDTIIEVAKFSNLPGASYAYWCVLLGALVTALYSFRSFFMVFHGQPRMDKKTYDHVHESPWVIGLPLVVLAIPSVILGYILYAPMILNHPSLLSDAVHVLPVHPGLQPIAEEIHSPMIALAHSVTSPVFWLTLTGIMLAALFYLVFPTVPAWFAQRFQWIYRILLNKYGFDWFNDHVLVNGSKLLGRVFYRAGDQALIDGAVVNGSGKLVRWVATYSRNMQDGYLYHYVLVMILGLFGFLFWFLG
ncbi:MAG: NADH-quinone oxidoreductase subunit L [Legionellaceae bacterium]|nr:NADH-quinone oxidoreductase subunit L [Legionellaceae bacterium]MBP9775281.1 NADH-quinone oxidoreductase subunit L [Legionellaceae bacterium]